MTLSKEGRFNCTRNWSLVGALACAMICGSEGFASATALTPYFLTAITQANSVEDVSRSATVDLTTTNGRASATVDASISPFPSATASASVTGVGGESSAYFNLGYYFRINSTGGSATAIPIVIDASGGVTQSIVSTGNEVFVQLSGLSSGAVILGSACSNKFPATCGIDRLADQLNFSSSVTENLTVGTQYEITIQLFVAANTNTGATSDNQSGFVDPFISFEHPEDASLYSFEFSDGIGNNPINQIPIPASLSLFAPALGVLGLLHWRRSKKLAS